MEERFASWFEGARGVDRAANSIARALAGHSWGGRTGDCGTKGGRVWQLGSSRVLSLNRLSSFKDKQTPGAAVEPSAPVCATYPRVLAPEA